MTALLGSWNHWIVSLSVLGGIVFLGFFGQSILFALLEPFFRRTGSVMGKSLIHHCRKPAAWILPLILILLVLPSLSIPEAARELLRHFDGIGLIIVFAWLSISLIYVFSDQLTGPYKMDVKDNLQARRIQTQILVLRRLIIIFIGMITAALILMTFPTIRHIGTGLFASAGIIGLAAGMAARPVLANLIAGVQIALAQPIRLDDVVIVEGEWGWIEEIRTTFVVVRIWDLRRLVVPLTYFIEKPFQNWTRRTSDLLGTAFIYTDYSVPVEAVRRELFRILNSTDLWDRQVWGLQVSNATERVVELRALMSSADSSQSWDLRCLVREKLIEFLQAQYPESLSKTRIWLQHQDAQTSEASDPRDNS